MPKHTFDLKSFAKAIEIEKLDQKLTWKAVAEAAGVKGSTLTRMSQGMGIDLNNMAALAAWARLDLNNFVVGSERLKLKMTCLPEIAHHIASDPYLSVESANIFNDFVSASYRNFRTLLSDLA